MFFLFSIIPSVIYAQEISWVDINGQRGFSDLKEGSGGTLYALQFSYINFSSSVYYSLDTGYSWSKHSFNYNDIYDYSIKGNYIVMDRYVDRSINPHQVFLSTDGGGTFSRIIAEDSYAYDGITISDSFEIFGVYQNFILSQYINGTWTTIGTPIPYYISGWSLLVDPLGDFIFYGGSRFGGVVVSTDRGMTWNRSLESKNISYVTADKNGNLIAGGINTSEFVPSGLYLSSDNGITWKMLVSTDDLYFNSLAVDDSGNIYGATQRNIYIYRMNEKISEEVAPLIGGYESILYMSDGSIIASSSDNGIYHSSNRGRLWLPHSPRAEDIYALKISSAGTIIVGTLGNGILRSTNDGGRWEYVHPSVIPRYIFSLWCGNNVIYAGTDKGVYRSIDDGINWVNCTTGYFTGNAGAVCMNNAGDIFVGTSFGVYRSTNNGDDWILSGLSGIEVPYLTSDNNGKVVAASPNSGIYCLDEYINNEWNMIGPPLYDIQSLTINSAGDIFAGVFGGVYKRDHETLAWTKVSFTTSYIYSLAINDDQDIIAGTYNGAFISRNNGALWNYIPLTGSVMSMDFNMDQKLFAGVYRKGVFHSASAVTSVSLNDDNFPDQIYLAQNYPNPFNPYTRIIYSIPHKGNVKISVFNNIGQEIKLLVNEEKNPGSYEVIWDGAEYPSGTYFARMNFNGKTKTIRMLLMK